MSASNCSEAGASDKRSARARQRALALRAEERTKIRRSDELQTERGEAGFEQALFKRLDLAAGRNDDNGAALALSKTSAAARVNQSFVAPSHAASGDEARSDACAPRG